MYRVEIVPLVVEHIDEIMVIENLSFKIPWSRESFIEEITKNRFAIYIAAKTGGQVIGYAGMWEVSGEGHITNIAVHPEFRCNKVGSLLVEGLVNIAKSKDIKSMTLEVRKSNVAAQALYSKYGFEARGFRKRYYADDNEDAVIMWKYGI